MIRFCCRKGRNGIHAQVARWLVIPAAAFKLEIICGGCPCVRRARNENHAITNSYDLNRTSSNLAMLRPRYTPDFNILPELPIDRIKSQQILEG
jgi:hypothetical protein